jgi:hypothetical protein
MAGIDHFITFPFVKTKGIKSKDPLGACEEPPPERNLAGAFHYRSDRYARRDF